MAILSFKIPVESSPRSIIIDNWRYITAVRYNYGNNQRTEGTKIVLPDQTIDVMGYTPPMIKEIIHNDELVENVIFSRNLYEYPGYCYKCGGLGKIDWVTGAMGDSGRHVPYNRYATRFVRDKKIVMFYYDGDYRFNKLFARVELEEGYRICANCKGTGMALDARQRIFQGMPGLKRKLKAFEWDGLNTPG
jgi:hypothetical protein